jgi:type IV pilus assembly protein PilF
MKGRTVYVATACALLALALAAPAQARTTRQARDQAAAVNTELALAYVREGNLGAAREKITKALEQNPRTPRTQMAAGFVYERLGDARKARSHYDQAARLGRDDPDVLNNVAVYYCRTGQFRRGEELLVLAAASPLYRTPDAALTNAGRCARSDGRDADAEQHFRRAIAANPRQADALLQLAELSLARGNALQARAFLERHTAAAPVSAATLWLGYRIETAAGDPQQADRYAQRLRSEYPTSQETTRLFEGERGRP